MNQNFRLGYPEIAVSNESWAIGPNIMSNSYSAFNADMKNVLKYLVIIVHVRVLHSFKNLNFLIFNFYIF